MKTFRSFTLSEQERTYDVIRMGLDGKGFDNEIFQQALNAALAKTCSHTFITPYVALGSISRVLAYGRIILPQVTFDDKERGNIVFDIHQFGDVHGKNFDGTVADSNNDVLGNPVKKFFVFFSYHMEPDGFYDCFVKVCDGEELGELLSGQENIDDDTRLHEDQINEISQGKLVKYIEKNRSSGSHPYNSRKQDNRDHGLATARAKIGATKYPGSARVHATEESEDNSEMRFPQYHEDLPSYKRKLAIEEPINEISKKKLSDYSEKARVDANRHLDDAGRLAVRRKPGVEKHMIKHTRRLEGLHNAFNKTYKGGKRARVPATEEIIVTEMSKGKLVAYREKAKEDRKKNRTIGREKALNKLIGIPRARVPAQEENENQMAHEYHVIDNHTKEVIGRYKNRHRARRHADRKDLEYGAIKHIVKPIWHNKTNEEPQLIDYARTQATGKQIQEVSRKTTSRYLSKAISDRKKAGDKALDSAHFHNGKDYEKYAHRFRKRQQGISTATKKLSGKAKVPAVYREHT